MPNRTGILGGSFNPVHNGHLTIARDAMEHFELQGVLFVPCADPPHKNKGELLPAGDRLAMLEAALEGESGFEVSTVELEREGISYSIDTVRHFIRQDAGMDWYFIIGTDSLLELHTWKEVHELLTLCTFAILERPGFDPSSANDKTIRLEDPWPETLKGQVCRGHPVDISSTGIRQNIRGGESVEHLVPEVVEAYIREHRLYAHQEVSK